MAVIGMNGFHKSLPCVKVTLFRKFKTGKTLFLLKGCLNAVNVVSVNHCVCV